MAWTHDKRLGGPYKWSGHRIEGLRGCINALYAGLETELGANMVWTKDEKLGGLWKWFEPTTRGWVGCINGLNIR